MALCAFLGIYYLSDPSLFLNVSPTFEFRNADDERKRKMWFEIADGNRTFTFSFAAQQYTQNSQNSTPNSIFKKICTIFVYFGIYLYFFFWFFVNVNQHYRFWQPSFRRSPNGGGCGKKNGNDTEDLEMAYIYFLTNLELLELVTSDRSSM